MAYRGRYKSTLKRIEAVQAIAREHYEEGNQSKCYKAIWRKYIYEAYGICYQTFIAYLNTDLTSTITTGEDPDQLQLF